MKPSIIIASDHAGFTLKGKLAAALVKNGYGVHDLSPHLEPNDDYPDIGKQATMLAVKTKRPAILICGTGVGMTIAANRIKGARAAVGHDVKEVERGRRDDHINILALSGWNMPVAKAVGLVETFLKIPYSKASRHIRRVKKLG